MVDRSLAMRTVEYPVAEHRARRVAEVERQQPATSGHRQATACGTLNDRSRSLLGYGAQPNKIRVVGILIRQIGFAGASRLHAERHGMRRKPFRGFIIPANFRDSALLAALMQILRAFLVDCSNATSSTTFHSTSSNGS